MKKTSFPQNMRLVKPKQTCEQCDVERLCISAGIDVQYANKFNEIVRPDGPYEAGEAIYRRGDHFKSLYVVQCGVAKSETDTVDGRHQVTGFYLPGDLIGIDSVSTGRQPCDVIAVGKTWVCEIPFTQLEQLCIEVPGLLHEVFMRMARRIHHDEYNSLVSRGEPADTRVLSFLAENFQKLAGSKYISGNYLHLPMSKADLSSYLGMKPETFSRSMKRLQDKGYIINSAKHIEIVNLEGMGIAAEK
jgi:CRP/FNR family transcriptional regulator